MTQSIRNGFTLVELAIALMVIGLLIGGVLKGQELIENAKITSTIRQIDAYKAAVMIFRNTYNAFPGDIKKPQSRIPNCTTEICIIGGNGNGKIIWSDNAIGGLENMNFFPHLTKAGMIQGPEGGTEEEINSDRDKFLPTSVISGTYDPFIVQYSNASPAEGRIAGHYYQLYGMSCKSGQAFDDKLDDGNPAYGEIKDASGECYLDDGDGNFSYDLAKNYSEIELYAGY